MVFRSVALLVLGIPRLLGGTPVASVQILDTSVAVYLYSVGYPTPTML